MEERLSGAYGRILRVALVFSLAGTLVAALLFTWQSALGLAIGSLLAYINFVWLHRGTERLVERILASNKATTNDKSKSRKLRFAFPFPLRYGLLIAVAYVILKSYPRLLIGFLTGEVPGNASSTCLYRVPKSLFCRDCRIIAAHGRLAAEVR
jgi:hypothetical protein